jgi:hypothetical protein
MTQNLEAFDCLVIGAGTAGIPSAVTSARYGAKTLIIEKQATIGGLACDLSNFALCGVYCNDQSDFYRFVNPGTITEEIISKLTGKPETIRNLKIYRYCPHDLRNVFKSMMDDCGSGLTVLTRSQVTKITCQETYHRCTLQTPQGEKVIRVNAVIDTSGIGALKDCCNLISYSKIPDELRQMGGICFHVSIMKFNETLQSYRRKFLSVIYKAAENGDLPEATKLTSCISLNQSTLLFKLNLPTTFYNDRTAAELCHRIFDIICANDDHQQLLLSYVSDKLHYRDSLRPQGEYLLTEDDVKTGRKFVDVAMRGSWPIEFWNSQRCMIIPVGNNDGCYDIPYGALTLSEKYRLYCAGKTLCAEPMALAAARVMGQCFAMGEAIARKAVK